MQCSRLPLISLMSSLLALASCATAQGPKTESDTKPAHFDFGAGPVGDGYVAVGLADRYDTATGYGWIDTDPETTLRDRQAPDPLRQDYVFGRKPLKFKVDVAPGVYKVTLIAGDMQFGDHVLQPSVDVESISLPKIQCNPAEFATLTFGVKVPEGKSSITFTFDSPENNWVVNALAIDRAGADASPSAVNVEKKQFDMPKPKDTWSDVSKTPDPSAALLKQFRENLNAGDRKLRETGIHRDDYLKLVAGNVDFFKQFQNADGAIIDPYRKIEFQYSTPCFAWAATALVEYADRKDLLEPAARAMDWAALTLSEGRAANHHEDFFPPQIAHALPLLKKHVDPARYDTWIKQLSSYNPYIVYRAGPGAGNWNVVSLSGEYLFTKLGIRKDDSFVERSLAAQGNHFDDPFGLYTEGPMAYDHFPRLWAADLIANGYDGIDADKLREVLRRAAITSLFMQSPAGELPAGGRSAHHQWNEAEQAVTYEIYAGKALADGDAQLAGVFKRAAHVAFSSMLRWQRPSGEMWIVKNKFDPAKFIGYESYSSHSQYNLLPMAMLCTAYQHAADTESVREVTTPAEVGGFVVDIRPTFHKVIANAGGMYIEIDTAGDMEHNPTGLIRIHKSGFNPQLGPSDGITTHTVEQYPDKPTESAAVGVAWKSKTGAWLRLAELGANDIKSVDLKDVTATPARVEFTLNYTGNFDGPTSIVEHYVITPDKVEQTTTLPGYTGPAQLVWPVLAEQGEEIKTDITLQKKTVSVTLGGDTQTFTTPNADKVALSDGMQPHRNGYVRIATAEFYDSKDLSLIIEPKQ